jgi:hypothetical protein
MATSFSVTSTSKQGSTTRASRRSEATPSPDARDRSLASPRTGFDDELAACEKSWSVGDLAGGGAGVDMLARELQQGEEGDEQERGDRRRLERRARPAGRASSRITIRQL